MTETEFYTLLFYVLEAGLERYGFIGVDARQANQPRVVGTPVGPSVLVSNISTRRYGFLRREDTWDGDSAMIHKETQTMEVVLQCGALVPAPPPPATLPTYTAGDLTGICAQILQSDLGRETLKIGGVGIERITDIRQPTFVDDKNQFEASPSFDFTVTFDRVYLSTSPRITKEAVNIQAV